MTREASTPDLAEDSTVAVLRVVDQVVADLQRHHTVPSATLRSNLQSDLGLDSLALAEILVCLEEAFGIQLPSSVLAWVETPGDLVRAVREASPERVPRMTATTGPRVPGTAGAESPTAAQTLVEVLDWHCAHHPQRVHLHLVDETGPAETITYEDLRARAAAVAHGLIDEDLMAGEAVALMLPTGRSYFDAFMGVLMAGGVPVPIYPPARPSQLEDHLRRHSRLLTNARAGVLITVPEARPAARLLRSSVATMRRVVTVDELMGRGGSDPLVRPAPDATALLQYTSGSTGQPKGVVLSHAAVLANIRAMGQAAQAGPTDTFVSWLPLYHDMGLIGAWLGSLCLDMSAVIMSPLMFLARPVRWLEAIDAYRATLTGGPNFAYELCLRKVTDADIDRLDLSCLRMALNGAEPVSAATMERFNARFARCGLPAHALAPVYGLAECALGLAFPPPGRGLLIDSVSADALQTRGRADPVPPGSPPVRRVVACGVPLPGYQIRVVDDDGKELPERAEGRIEFTGPSATSGYFHNPGATAQLFDGDWLVTGDLGYVAGGDLYITGRSTDLIIRAGRNLHPEELEGHLGDVDGVRKGCVAVLGIPDPARATDELVILAETHASDEDDRAAIRAAIAAATVDLLGVPPDDVVLAPPGTVLKTSSGKIRRSACIDLYRRGAVGAPPRAAWWQLARFAARGITPRLRNRRRALASLVYAAYCWALFALVGLPTLSAVAVMPSLAGRRRLVRAAARSLLWLSGTPVSVRGATDLPAGAPCVVVSNHQSWLDAVLLTAWLPPRFVFVAGEVFERQRVAGFLMRRIGTQFVTRFDPSQGVAEAAHLAELMADHSLMIFPEGGLSRVPGLRPFHLGAFVAAAESHRPVVPLAIRGTRSMLRPGHRFTRRGSVHVVVGEPILAEGEGWLAAVHLGREARQFVLGHCGEPDLD